MGSFSNFLDNLSSSVSGRNKSWPMLAHEIVKSIDDEVLRYIGRSPYIFRGKHFCLSESDAEKYRAFLLPQMVFLSETSCVLGLPSVAGYEDNETDIFISEARDSRVFSAMRKELHKSGNNARFHLQLCEALGRYAMSFDKINEVLYTGFKVSDLYVETVLAAQKKFQEVGSSDCWQPFKDEFIHDRLSTRPYELFCKYMRKNRVHVEDVNGESIWSRLLACSKEQFVLHAEKARIPEICEDFVRAYR